MENIVERLDKETQKNIRQSPRNSNRASELGWWEECPRYLVLIRTDSDKLPLHDIGLQRIFDEGRKQEKLIRMELEEAGYEIKDVQRDEKWTHLEITGHIDGKIKTDGKFMLLEIKSCSPNVFRAISNYHTADELRASKHSWIRHYYSQIQAYHLLFGEEEGVILFKDKSTGKKHQVLSILDYEYCERMCKVMEEVNKRIKVNDPWPVEEKSACRHCGFQKTVCFPNLDFGPGYDFLSDEETEMKLLRWEELRESASEFQDLDKDLKEHFKGKSAVVGDFLIESKEFERTNYSVPDDVRKKYAEIKKYWRTSINKL